MNLSLNKGQGSDAERLAAAVQAITLIDKHNLLRGDPGDVLKLDDLDADVDKNLASIRELITNRSKFDMNHYTVLHLSTILAVSLQIRQITRLGLDRIARVLERRA